MSYPRPCVKHNKQILRHLLEVDPCDGWCSSANPCDEMIITVKNCDKCENGANPLNTYPYWYDGGQWCSIENDEEVDDEEVLKYATN